ncbi:MAG TPA: glycerate kinase [Nitriliruptorales bacterium]
MRVVVAPDSFGGSLTAHQAAAAIVEGWQRARPGDEVVSVPLSDGGEGLIDVVRAVLDGPTHELEVAGPHGKPVRARWLQVERTAYVESAEAAGLNRLPADERGPLRTTTYGVGQVLEAVRAAGAQRVVVGLGGSATVDAGAGALTALGLRLLGAGGNGLKVGGGNLHYLEAIDRGWLSGTWGDIEVVCWADVRTPLLEAAQRFGPQKGATPEDVGILRRGIERFSAVIERDLDVDPSLREAPGTGAAGGLGYGLAAVLGASIVDGAAAVLDAVGFQHHLGGADLVVTGEGGLDRTSLDGKVVGRVVDEARRARVAVAAVAGRLAEDVAEDVGVDVEEASPGGPGDDPATDVADAAARLAGRFS